MDKLMIFEEREVLGMRFRIYGTKDKPLFLAKDVAELIDYSWTNSKKTARQVGKMLKTIDEDEKMKGILGCNNSETKNLHGGLRENTEAWFLTESGLYEVLLQSRKPIAKIFKEKVKAILRQIRKTGGYIPITAEDSDEKILEKALLIAETTLELKNKEK